MQLRGGGYVGLLPRPLIHLPRTRRDRPTCPFAGEVWWAESLKLLTDFHFLEMLLGYDKDSMTGDVAAQVGAGRGGECGGSRWRSCASSCA